MYISLAQEDPPEKRKAIHSSILAWRIPWSEEPWGHKRSDTTEWLTLSLSNFSYGFLILLHGDQRLVFIPIPKKGNAKECSNYRTIALISHTSKVMLKILQARLQQYVNRELPDVQAGFRKGRGIRDQIANIHWIIKKAREFQKKHLFLLD